MSVVPVSKEVDPVEALIVSRPVRRKEQETPVEFWRRLREEGLSVAEIGAEVGYDGSVVSKVMSGSYGGDMEAIHEAFAEGMRRYLGSSDGAVVKTDTALMVEQRLRGAHGSEWLTVMYGPPGIGKTDAIKRYMRKCQTAKKRRRCLLITINQMASARTVVIELAAKLGLSPRGDTSFIVSQVIEALKQQPHLVILDECNNACGSPRRAGSLLNTLRQVNDEAACGIVFVGTSNLSRVLRDPRNRDLMEMVQSRIEVEMELFQPEEIEVQALLAAHFGPVSAGAWKAFVEGLRGLDLSLRRAAVFVRNVKALMQQRKMDEGAPLTASLAKDAWERTRRDQEEAGPREKRGRGFRG